jgi:hypothetical protein
MDMYHGTWLGSIDYVTLTLQRKWQVFQVYEVWVLF